MCGRFVCSETKKDQNGAKRKWGLLQPVEPVVYALRILHCIMCSHRVSISCTHDYNFPFRTRAVYAHA